MRDSPILENQEVQWLALSLTTGTLTFVSYVWEKCLEEIAVWNLAAFTRVMRSCSPLGKNLEGLQFVPVRTQLNVDTSGFFSDIFSCPAISSLNSSLNTMASYHASWLHSSFFRICTYHVCVTSVIQMNNAMGCVTHLMAWNSGTISLVTIDGAVYTQNQNMCVWTIRWLGLVCV